MARGSISIALAFSFVWSAFAQCLDYDEHPPQLRDVAVRCSVVKDTTPFFIYRYLMINGATSTGCISSFDIDIRRPPNSAELPTFGLEDYPRYVRREALGMPNAIDVIPVAIPILPKFKGQTSAWSADFGIDGSVGWMRALPKYLLEPGMKLDGLVLTTYGLPRLRTFVVGPKYHPVPDTTRNETTEEEEKAFARVLDSIKVKGTTIGPTAPPSPFVPSSFLDTLLSYTRQSAKLGWIGKDRDDDCDDDERPDDGIVRNIEQRLQKAKRELAKGDTVQTRMELGKLVQKIERLWKRSQKEEKNDKRERWEKQEKVIITSEAYALLKFNAEYLIDSLPRKKGGKDRDDKDHR
jgi:hypothetical protein